jgi:hypothetical protein
MSKTGLVADEKEGDDEHDVAPLILDRNFKDLLSEGIIFLLDDITGSGQQL